MIRHQSLYETSYRIHRLRLFGVQRYEQMWKRFVVYHKLHVVGNYEPIRLILYRSLRFFR